MPIRINLLAETQHEAEVRRRDPVKRAMIGAGVIVVSVIAYYVSLVTKQAVKSSVVKSNKERLAAIQADAAAAQAQLSDVTELEKRIHQLNNLATNRVLWGTFLNEMQTMTVENVVVRQILVSQGYDTVRPPPVRNIPQPATSRQHIIVRIRLRDYGAEAEQRYIQYQTKLLSNPWLKARLREEKPIEIEQFGKRTTSFDDPDRSFREIVFKCTFKALEFR